MSLYRFVIQQYDTLPPPAQEIVFALGLVVVSAGAVTLALIAATYLYPVLDRIWPMPEIQTHPEILNDESRSADGDAPSVQRNSANASARGVAQCREHQGGILKDAHEDRAASVGRSERPDSLSSFRRDPLLFRDQHTQERRASLSHFQRSKGAR